MLSLDGNVWVSPAGDVWVSAGPGGLYRLVDGELRPDPEIRAMWAHSAKEIMPVTAPVWGTAADDIWLGDFAHFDGSHWQPSRPVPPVDSGSVGGRESVDAVWGAARDHYLLLINGQIKEYDGRAWSSPKQIVPGRANWAMALGGTSRADVHAVGYAFLAHFDGKEWHELPGTRPSDWAEGFAAVWAKSTVEAYAAGSCCPKAPNGQCGKLSGLLARWDGTAWSEVASPAQEPLVGVTGCDGRLFVTSRHALFERPSSGTWETRLTARPDCEFQDVHCSAGLLAVYQMPSADKYKGGESPCPALWLY